MTRATAPHTALDPTHAARLERLAARHDRRNTALHGEALLAPPVTRPVGLAIAPPSAPASAPAIGPASASPADQPATSDVDAALKARLDKLAAARSGAGRSQVPPSGRTNAPANTGSKNSATKRRHPAKHSRTAALTLSVLASGGLGFLFAATDTGVSASPVAPSGIVSPSAPVVATPTVAVPADTATGDTVAADTVAADTVAADTIPAATTPAVTVAALPVTVNGDSFRNKWGDVQVQATFAADGTLTDVTTLQVPFRDGKSVRINDAAVPRLNREALTAQSANVDTVSGATYTSVGYKQSLQSAIDLAVANGIAVANSS